MNRGRFIVIEGTDGAGKGTQVQLLKEKLSELQTPFEVIDFPRYEDNEYGKLIGKYLRGELGDPKNLNRYLISLMYAGDRILAKPLIENWIHQGKIVIANRYVHSNVAYGVATLSGEAVDEFIKWNYDLEYETNSIQKEELVVLLYVDPEIAQKNIEQKGDRQYMGGKGKDIHEQDVHYQKDVANAYLYLAKQQPHWVIIDCALQGKMRLPEEIHEQIMEILKERGII